MINEAGSEKDIKIDTEKYNGCTVDKEYSTNDGELAGRIDILIKGENKGEKYCIVIENKLNNAPDTYRQLPKYYRYLKDSGYEIDAFVYMPLDPNKKPDNNGWNKEEIEFIEKKLVIIPAYSYSKDNSNNHTNLIENWLIPAEKVSTNDDAKFIIRQYKTLLNNLTIDIMDNSEVIDILSRDDIFETTINILDLKEQFCDKIKEDFIGNLKNRLENELKYEFSRQGKDKIEIKNPDYPSWSFVIEREGGNVNRWRRFLKYDEREHISIKQSMWSRENQTQPFGWAYYGEKDFDEVFKEEYRGFWTDTRTLAIMHDGTFANDIVKEIQEAFHEIEQQDLPK